MLKSWRLKRAMHGRLRRLLRRIRDSALHSGRLASRPYWRSFLASSAPTVVLLILLLTSACSTRHADGQVDQRLYALQAQVIQAQQQHLRRVEVTVEAPVYKTLRDDTEGLPHQRFLLGLVNGTTVLIAHDTNMAPRVPLSNGDWVRIHGEFIWTEKGGVIHWTHHTDTPRHEGGWIDFNGQRYQ